MPPLREAIAIPTGETRLTLLLRLVESIRDELGGELGTIGLRVELRRRPIPLAIGLDDAPTGRGIPLLLELGDPPGSLGTATIRGDRAFSVSEAATAAAILDRHAHALRDLISSA